MARRSTLLVPGSRDGTSQRSRRLPALDPAYAPIDERTTADLLAFACDHAGRLRFLDSDPETGDLRTTATWSDFVRHPDISVDDMVAYIADPTRFTGERARWLGRPHFALLLAFVELLGHAREQLNGFTRRHLDYYYREILGMQREPAAADRAIVVLGLAPGARELRLAAQTELLAGRDARGVPRIYRTERAIVVNRAAVVQYRSVFVDRRITGISDARADRSLTASAALTRTLEIALGWPGPGDPVPKFVGKDVDFAFVISLRDFLGFADTPLEGKGESLHLRHHELRSLMERVRRRRGGDADAEWAEINRRLGVEHPVLPRDFLANLTARVGPLDLAAGDALPQVKSVDDLYTYRADPAVRKFIDGTPDPGEDPHLIGRLKVIGFDNFVALMQIKLRIDAEWAEINRLIERIGRRQCGVLQWSLPPSPPAAGSDPADHFDANLAHALAGVTLHWPWGVHGIEDYDALLRLLEADLGMPVEQIATLVTFAEQLRGDAQSENHDWSDIDRLLADAHREKLRAGRQARLVEVRAGKNAAAFDKEASFVLGRSPAVAWSETMPLLAPHLDAAQIDLLDRFHHGLVAEQPLIGFGWSDADRLFELAWRRVQKLPDPVAQKVEVHNIYAYDDATQVKDDPAGPAWKAFGDRPARFDPRNPQGAMLGWALRSPALSLAEGTRTLTLTLGLRNDGFDQDSFLAALGITEDKRAGAALLAAFLPALQRVLLVEVSTAKAWIAVDITSAKFARGSAGDDYWSLRALARVGNQYRPALQLAVTIDHKVEPLAPHEGDAARQPALRLSLKQRPDPIAEGWYRAIDAFRPLVLEAVHLRVDVGLDARAVGLSTLRLQQDDRPLDPRKPLEPFGSRPAVGARLYIDHPELVRARLDKLRFDIEWMGLPARLKDHYINYPDRGTAGVFKVRVALIDRNIELGLGDAPLFDEDADGNTLATRSLPFDVAATVDPPPSHIYDSRSDLTPASDIRQASRYLRWELTPTDFGHGLHASLAAAKARELAIDIVNGKVKTDDQNPTTSAVAATYGVEPPYTPTIKSLRAAYSTAIEIEPATAAGDHEVVHVHPFGTCAIDVDLPSLLPRYDFAGELYIGIRDLAPPQHLTLLLQLAEGTSDPRGERASPTWWYLDGGRFRDLSGSGIVNDATRGLLNSGIVELALPEAVPDGRLPPELYWLRITLPYSPGSVCDVVSIHAQAVEVQFDDRGNAASHYAQPLPAGSIKRLVNPDAALTVIDQPYSSFGGRPAEPAELFDTRVSERLRHKMRALSAWDYERLVLHRFRQIYKAKCIATSGGVDVIVIPDIRALQPSDTLAPRAPADLLADIRAYLAERAPPAAQIRVRNPSYVQVRVRLGVRFRAGIDEGFARRRLDSELVRYLSPWAFDDGAELMIGGRIYANSILDFVARRDYVAFAGAIELSRSVEGQPFAVVRPVSDPVAVGDVLGEYSVATDALDQVLVAAPDHCFEPIPDTGYQHTSFFGINYARIELDFIVG